MDSGNSGSMQSSSGGDEEYDSRSESISAFLNSSCHGGGPISNPSPPPSHQHHPSLFDSLSNYLDPYQRSPPPPSNLNPLLNLDTAWSRAPPSDPNCTDIGTLTASMTPAPPISSLGSTAGSFPTTNIGPSTLLLSDNGSRPTPPTDHPTGRNPKKRSRASRRAPTTVLTTDTSNFRAMVQEFTGIPAPPFSASPFPRGGRLDLFNTALRSGLSEPLPPPYLLRPFAQKVQRPPAFTSLPLNSSSSNMVDAVSSTTNTSNYQLPSDLGPPKHNHNLLNMQNSILAIQSLLQSSPPKCPLPNLPIFGAKSQGRSMTNPMMDEFAGNRGSVGAHLGSLSNLTTSDAMPLRGSNSPSWGDGIGLNDGDQGHLKTFNGNYGNPQQVSSCKMNFTASSSDFHTEKGAENASSRGEGMVDSWICSSD
ncbi:proline-rich receptor-like protein kinase PERK12 [Magnolia sinica]|uniref:proline-rich receptor-like protein kinase PERK12 n=1 Tax=Magnolia sinica TaxID=86752 RepID=UPI00265829A7|nr:proline-rich receptor-like protein kinase PERK12 [Magnolia sinica]